MFLEVAFTGCHQLGVVVEQLETLLQVVVAEVFEGGAGLAATCGRVLEAGTVHQED